MPNKQQILESIKSIARRLGRAPSRTQFLSRSGIPLSSILHCFPTWSAAVRAAGLRSHAINLRLADRLLLEDWGRAVRKHRGLPPRRVYLLLGNYNPGTLANRFGGYSSMPEAFRNFAKGKRQWADVLALLPFHVDKSRWQRTPPSPLLLHSPSRPSTSKSWHPELPGQPTYGNPTSLPGFLHEPLNELGVVLLFGMLAKDLGFVIEAIHKEFPDCDAKRQVGPGRWQRVRIEFEFESKNFRDHAHPASRCDLIVCWRHNWPDHPSHLEILELSRLLQASPTATQA
jgi:Homing endonuclease associated repeat